MFQMPLSTRNLRSAQPVLRLEHGPFIEVLYMAPYSARVYVNSSDTPRKIDLVFFRNAAGTEPVRE